MESDTDKARNTRTAVTRSWLGLTGWLGPGWWVACCLDWLVRRHCGQPDLWPMVFPMRLSLLFLPMFLVCGCGGLGTIATTFDTAHRIAAFDRGGAFRSCEVKLGWTYQELTTACGRPYRATTGAKPGTIVLIYRTFATSMAPSRYLALGLEQDQAGPRRVQTSTPLVDLPADVSLAQ